MRLLEHESKARLGAAGVKVPRGVAAGTPDGAGRAAAALGAEVFVKALVPANRRSRNDGVIGPIGAAGVAAAANQLLGSRILGHPCRSVYVEETVAIARELYAAFSWGPDGPVATVSGAGGVDVEESGDGPVHLGFETPASFQRDRAEDLWRQALGDRRIPPPWSARPWPRRRSSSTTLSWSNSTRWPFPRTGRSPPSEG